LTIKELYNNDSSRHVKNKLAEGNDRKFGVWPHDEDSVRWCIRGAAIKCYDKSNWTICKSNDVMLKIADYLGVSGIDDVIAWNNAPERTFEEINKVVTELNI
jgi:hypothetical protein